MKPEAYYTYIIRSLKDGKYYYGSCDNLSNRLKKHNKGDIKSTKGRRPFVVHYSERYPTRSDAFRREKYFKSIDGYLWLKEQKVI
jgi:putative endonuclease